MTLIDPYHNPKSAIFHSMNRLQENQATRSESLPQRKTDVLSREERDQLLTRVNTNVAASLANPKSLEKCLSKFKKIVLLGLMVFPLSI